MNSLPLLILERFTKFTLKDYCYKMKEQKYINPFYIFFLTIPTGLSQGFVTVALPYLLIQHGFTVAQASAVVALGFSANVWRFLWGPIVDISLSLK